MIKIERKEVHFLLEDADFSKKNAFFAKVLESQKSWAKRVVPYRSVAHPPYDLAAEYYWGGENPYKVVK